MNYLATDPNVPALKDWSYRNSTMIEPVTEIPKVGGFLVSTLNVLTPQQFAEAVAGGVELVTADGLDCCGWTGTGDIQARVVRIVGAAVAKWAITGGAPEMSVNELQSLKDERERLLGQAIDLTGALCEEREKVRQAGARIEEVQAKLDEANAAVGMLAPAPTLGVPVGGEPCDVADLIANPPFSTTSDVGGFLKPATTTASALKPIIAELGERPAGVLITSPVSATPVVAPPMKRSHKKKA